MMHWVQSCSLASEASCGNSFQIVSTHVLLGRDTGGMASFSDAPPQGFSDEMLGGFRASGCFGVADEHGKAKLSLASM